MFCPRCVPMDLVILLVKNTYESLQLLPNLFY
jgi:hypothetical protein